MANKDEKSQPAKVQPSGYAGDNPATAGPERTAVNSKTPENRSHSIQPSAPNKSTNESGTPGKSGEGSVGYGGENKPMSQPDGTAADLEDKEDSAA